MLRQDGELEISAVRVRDGLPACLARALSLERHRTGRNTKKTARRGRDIGHARCVSQKTTDTENTRAHYSGAPCPFSRLRHTASYPSSPSRAQQATMMTTACLISFHLLLSAGIAPVFLCIAYACSLFSNCSSATVTIVFVFLCASSKTLRLACCGRPIRAPRAFLTFVKITNIELVL